MNALAGWLANVADPRWLPAILLLAKLSVLLGLAWIAHTALAHGNPRWRVLLWRTASLAVLLIAALSVCPPALSWAVLPANSASAPDVRAADSPSAPTPSPRKLEDSETELQLTASGTAAPESPLHTQTTIWRNRAPATDRISNPGPSAASPDALSSAQAPVDTVEAILPIQSARPVGSQAVIESGSRVKSPFGLAVAIWVVGALLMGTWTAAGAWRVAAIRRRSEQVPEWICAASAEISAQLQCRRRFSVRQTQEVASPCLTGIRRPLVLLPPTQCEPEHRDELPAILAHEIAHLKTADLQWNALLQGLSVLLWFHPLMWKVRSAHGSACDAVADAVAAEYVGDVASYGRTLARLAVRISSRFATPGLAMARTSQVRARIEALHRCFFGARLPRRRAICAVVLGLSAFAVLGAVTLAQSRAEPSQESNAHSGSPKAGGKKTSASSRTDRGSKEVAAAVAEETPGIRQMVIHAINDNSSEPLKDLEIRFSGRIGEDPFFRSHTVHTDGNGLTAFQWDADAKVRDFRIKASKQGFAPQYYLWSSDRRGIELPKRLELRLERGIEIGGSVQNESGQPIEGATVELTMPITWPQLSNHVFTGASLKTDKEGRWAWPNAPADSSSLSMRVIHPEYLRGGGTARQTMDNLTVLKQGLQVIGRVRDSNGRSIEGATARLGFDRFGTNQSEARTDVEGRFVLRNCKPGKSLVTVQADGLSPDFKELIIGEQMEDLDFSLDPGNTLRVRITDLDGNPVKDATFVTDTWRGYRTLKLRVNTDAEGRVVWRSAPKDTVLCDVFKSGYMALRRTPLKASDEEQAVTLYPELVVRGTVNDAVTGKPIEKFQIRHGMLFANRDQPYWPNDEGPTYTEGEYTYKFDEPQRGYYLQVVAPGYKAATSRMLESTEGDVTIDFELEPGRGPSGVVLLPDGEPAQEAEVALATPEKRAMLDNGHVDRRQNNADVTKTDEQGRFQFLPRDENEPYLLVIVHDTGFAEVTREQFQQSKRIKLQAWGRIEGAVRVGDRPDVNCEVSFYPKRPQGTHSFVFSYGYTTRTDQDGRFQFDRVIPGSGTVSRVVITEFLKSRQHSPGWQEPVKVAPRETTKVQIGGKGRPVTGQVQLDREPDVEINWTTNEPVEIQRWDQKSNRRSEDFFRCLANLDKFGRFRIPDVPTGTYRLTIPVNNPPSPNACGAGTAIGRGTHDFTVPEVPGGRSDEPLDLGTITATLFDTLEPGELAPDFVAQQLGDGTVRLRDLHGKLVLLDFWATWCAPCLADMPALKALHERHGGDERFVLLSASCDGEPEPAREYVENNRLDWLHAHVGATNTRVPTKYTVYSLPSTFLIGPDGRVLAKNLRGEELQRAVAAALKDEELFKATPRPPRFPIVRFDVPSDATPLAEPPAVVVLDDADPSWEENQPRHDGLRLLSASARELWAREGFNSCQTVGGIHGVAIDRRRERIYLRENVADRIVAFDLHGRKLWQVEQIEADALAVDEKTGYLWCSGGSGLNSGETVVFDDTGREVAAHPHRGIDIAYDPHSNAFWLVGYVVTKLSRDGRVLFQKPVEGWCCTSVSVNPTDGSVWIAERDHPDNPRSKNRLWLFDADGKVRRTLDLDDYDPFVVECHPQTGEAWISGFSGGIRRVSPTGEPSDPLKVQASNISINAAGDIWLTTAEGVLKLDSSGSIAERFPFPKESRQAWLAAF